MMQSACSSVTMSIAVFQEIVTDQKYFDDKGWRRNLQYDN